MNPSDMISIAKTTAIDMQLFPEVVCGIIERESTWIPSTIRFEPGWFNHTEDQWHSYIREHGFPNNFNLVSFSTERMQCSTSWGLMQPLGITLRERGCKELFLSALCDPVLGIEWGCKIFSYKLAMADGDLNKALLLYNGGGNLDYPNEVLEFAKKYKS